MTRCRPSRTASVLLFGAVSSFALGAQGNPTLSLGQWVEITPDTVTTGAPETCIGQGIAIDLQTPSTIYWGNTPYTAAAGGLFKTTDAGSTWTRIGAVTPAYDGASDHLDMPLHIRLDPHDSKHLYAGDGVRGSSNGFFVSTDGGLTFVKPQGFVDARMAAGIDNEDIYDVAVNPVDFKHVLITFHYRWGWTETKWNASSGVMESKDGGGTWIIHEPEDGWGSGHAIEFLFDPVRGIGDANTWLLGTQGAGFWRTTDAGSSWTKVSDTNISHGGGTVYYTDDGKLYASGEQTMRSTDNGATWSSAGPSSTWAVHGDGMTLYTGRTFGANQPFQVSPETDGMTWANFNSQNFSDGPYEMAYDSTNGILYSSNWSSGVWALKVGEGTGMIPIPPEAGNGGSAGTGGGAAMGGSGTGGASVGSGGGPTSGGGGAVSGGSVASGGAANAGSPGNVQAGAASPTGAAGPADAGCACRTTQTQGTNSAWLSALLLGTGLALARRGALARAFRASWLHP